MKILKDIADKNLWEDPLSSGVIPDINLYMDQILSLTEDKGVTKTMINNYSKEQLIKPLKGKKYSKEQIIQILCVMNLKQSMALADIRELMPQDDGVVDFNKVYDIWTEKNVEMEQAVRNFVQNEMFEDTGLAKEEQALLAAMMLSSCSIYLRKLCGELASQEEEQA